MALAVLRDPATGALHTAVVEALAHPTMRRVLDDASTEPGRQAPGECRAFMLTETERYRALGARTNNSMD